MHNLKPVTKKDDIPATYRDTPIGRLLEYHNIGLPLDECKKAQLLIAMCMDNRKHLRIPNNFAFIIRTGGANLRYSEFKVSYAISVGGVRYIALIGHNQCGMVGLASRKDQFVKGLVDGAGWESKQAAEYFDGNAPSFEIGNEIDFVLSEAKRLKARYPKITAAPLIYNIEDNLLYLVDNS